MNLKAKKGLVIGVVTALSMATVASVSALAIYKKRETNQSNKITIGQTVDTVVLRAETSGSDAEMYPGDSRTVTYDVDLTGHTAADVTVTWTLSATKINENATSNYAEDDFTVTATTTADGETESNSVTMGTTTIKDGKLAFTITMNNKTEIPTYSEVTLSVTLAVAGDSTQG